MIFQADGTAKAGVCACVCNNQMIWNSLHPRERVDRLAKRSFIVTAYRLIATHYIKLLPASRGETLY